MDDSFARRVCSAAVAAWWSVLIGGIWLTASWLIYLVILAAQPGWLLKLWGGGSLGWEKVQSIVIMFMAVAKLILWTCVVVALWLTIWGRRLKRGAASERPA